MATGHINPGHGNIVTTLQRARFAQMHDFDIGTDNLKSVQRISNESNLDSIRKQARETWLKRDINETSYQDHFKDRYVEVQEFQKTRPSSAERKNKPHPTMIFLTNRLHHVPGYHNADTTLAKGAYRIDDSMTPTGKAERDKFKEKFVPQQRSAAVDQYKLDEELKELVCDPRQRQGYAAAIKLTNERENILGKLRDLNARQDIRSKAELQRSYRPRTVPSLHRHLKLAGAAESAYLNNIYNKHISGTDNYYGHCPPVNVVDQRYQVIERLKSVPLRGSPISKRGDFLMHPDWPPRLQQHRLNGLSSVDGQFSNRW